MEESGIRFVGNVEGRDIPGGEADVLVTDGFTGNVVLKTAEGVAREILGMVRGAMTANTLTKLAGGILRPRLLAVRSEEHTSELQSRQYLVCRLLLEKKNQL